MRRGGGGRGGDCACGCVFGIWDSREGEEAEAAGESDSRSLHNPLSIHSIPHPLLLSPLSSTPSVQFATWLKRKLVIEPALAAVRKERAEHRPDTSLGQEKWMQ